MKREEIKEQYKWAIDEIIEKYPLEETIERSKQDCETLESYRGRFDKEENILQALKLSSEIMLALDNLITYCHLKLNEDNRISNSQINYQLALQAYTNFLEKSSFIEPQILELGEEKILQLAQKEAFEEFDFYLKKLVRQKAHVLSEKEEAIFAGLNEVISAPTHIFDMLIEADMKFGQVELNGQMQELTLSTYSKFMENQNQQTRRDAFKKIHSKLGENGNTISAMYATNVKSYVIGARLKKYSSSLEASLFDDNIPVDVYHNLIKTVKKNLPLFQRFVELKKRSLNMQEFHIYDIYLPFVKDFEKKISFDDAFDTIVEALAPLGEEYTAILSKAREERWMDVYPNEGKAGGAYSSGTHDSKPFILLNHNDKYSDMSTMAHELGHSMHSYFARSTQPSTKSEYSLFIAEVASTVNEIILIKHLLNKVNDHEEKKFLIGKFLEQFKGTLFRQVMFADFEARVHESFENNHPMSMEGFNELFYNLNREFFGDSLILDEEIKYEWMRIHHFYRAFYVFMYSTSYCAAIAIATKILEGNQKTLDGYLNALKSGGSLFPIEALKLANIDMNTQEPIELALDFFKDLLDQYEACL